VGKGQGLPRHRRSLVRPVRVLFLIAEATPLAKVGGLGDVGGALPRALRALGYDVRTSLPRYPSIDIPGTAASARREITVRRGGETLSGALYRWGVRGVPHLLIDGEPVARDRGVYGGGREEGEKFLFWCDSVLNACRDLRWAPDIVHANDWHAAAAIARLHALRDRDSFWSRTATVLTIHNLAYAGVDAVDAWRAYHLPVAEGSTVPEWARPLPLASAITHADSITTVSPSYAEEITTPELGFGLDPLLRARREPPVGILNGIDPAVWNPSSDRALPARFTAATVERREKNKTALLAELGFEGKGDVPLLAFIGRMESQKGIDLLLQALATLLELPWMAVVLGTGQPAMEAMTAAFEQGHGRLRYRRDFDDPLGRRIYGAADLIVVPSRFEPCGLVQMISMRYGTVPIVHATGGLRDTVRDQRERGGTGFVFDEPSAHALAAALRRAMDFRKDARAWRGLQLRGMRQDFSWDRAARKYAAVYRQALRNTRGRRS
jgi:starch synthase